MRTCLLAPLAFVVATLVPGADFATAPPHPIAGLTDWEVVSGELASPRLSAGYRFYVDPARQALFTVMRYRLGSARPTGEGGIAVPRPTEKFVWNERPGHGVPLRCFELVAAGTPTGAASAWREMTAGSPEYVQEMNTLLAVLAEQGRQFQQQLAPR